MTQDEVESDLLKLHRMGFLDVFIYDNHSQSYIKIEAGTHPPSELWFMTNKNGQGLIDRYWDSKKKDWTI
jgi:hypothetical protein